MFTLFFIFFIIGLISFFQPLFLVLGCLIVSLLTLPQFWAGVGGVLIVVFILKFFDNKNN